MPVFFLSNGIFSPCMRSPGSASMSRIIAASHPWRSSSEHWRRCHKFFAEHVMVGSTGTDAVIRAQRGRECSIRAPNSRKYTTRNSHSCQSYGCNASI
jgi:hypothetical protein